MPPARVLCAVRRRKKAKGPNPLAVKKKKARGGPAHAAADEAGGKKKRRRRKLKGEAAGDD